MIEFGLMIRPIMALAAPARKKGNRIGPQPPQMKAAAGLQRRFWSFLMAMQAVRALARAEALWQGSARLVGAFWADSRIRYAAVAQW